MQKFLAIFDQVFFDLARHMRWSYVPPLLVYFAAGISGLTAIAGTFFVKEYLGLSAEFLASLAFWAGLPWIMKLPLGHLVDLIWRWKSTLVYIGALLIGASISIMYGLIGHTDIMRNYAGVEVWFVTSVLLAPLGYVVQDVVADAMTVEAVPTIDENGNPHPDEHLKVMHTTMQTLGRIAIISGTVAVALANVILFSGVDTLSPEEISDTYLNIYLIALTIPCISILGVSASSLANTFRARQYKELGFSAEKINALMNPNSAAVKPNYLILFGSLLFASFTLGMGLSDFVWSQEVIFAGSLLIILFLIQLLLKELPQAQRFTLIGTATIIFIFRAIPSPGPGVTWWEIDILGFDQQFLAILTLITSLLTIAGMILLRPIIAKRSISYVILLLTLAGGILALPNLGLYYGIQNITEAWTGGVVDARFIAILDTMLESPLGQIAMIPLLAWIARNAPNQLKATYFAVMASFTNLALSASSLGTKYLNQVFIVTREVIDAETDKTLVPADYSQVGWLLIATALIGVSAPVLAILLVQNSRYKTEE